MTRRFLFKLAIALGKTVEQLGRELSSHELSEWMAYYRLEPFGEERADLRAGIIASTVVNCTPRKSPRQYRPADFMPQFDRPNVEHDPEQKAERLMFKNLKRLIGGGE